ncbi:MAG: patatin-like phospholipase family protein [Fibrobacterota bacterium]
MFNPFKKPCLSREIREGKEYSLVLSGGAALGLAHLGIIRSIQEHEITPSHICGTSMGAIIGGLYACGFSYRDLCTVIDEFHLLRMLSLKFNKHALLGHAKIRDYLATYFDDIRVCDVSIPLSITATNADTGKMEVFSSTSSTVLLLDAVCASFSIPAVFPSYKIGKTAYYDGMLCEHLPITPARNARILAVDVLNRYSLNGTSIPYGLRGVIQHAFLISTVNQTHLVLRANNASRIAALTPNLAGYDVLDFKHWQALADCGYAAIEQYLCHRPSQ